MPLFRHNGALYHFAHVPKAGGQSVTRYLQQRFGPLAFLDNEHGLQPPATRWTRASPQHVPWKNLRRLVPASWIAGSFAVVRHPVARFASAYNFLSVRARALPAGLSPEAWFEEYIALRRRLPFFNDGHLLAQCEIVPPEAAVFRFEDGLQALVPFLDRLAGDRAGPREIPHVNAALRPESAGFEARPLGAAFVRKLEIHYSEDFARFGYTPLPADSCRVCIPRERPRAHELRPLVQRSLLARRAFRSIVVRTGWSKT